MDQIVMLAVGSRQSELDYMWGLGVLAEIHRVLRALIQLAKGKSLPRCVWAGFHPLDQSVSFSLSYFLGEAALWKASICLMASE